MTDLINFDGMATSTVRPEVLEAMSSWIGTNSSPSSLHPFGEASAKLHSKCKAIIGQRFECLPEGVTFTSGVIESDNIAIRGLAQLRKHNSAKIAILSTDPLSIIQSARALEKEGWELTIIPVDKFGVVNLEAINNIVDNDTSVVCCHLVNEETGAIQPIGKFAELIKRFSPRALIHCNARAAFGRFNFTLSDLGVDSLSIEAQTVGGPAGIGALLTKEGFRIPPMMFGGGHSGTRPGNIPNSLISGFAACCSAELIPEAINSQIAAELELMDLGNCCWTVDPSKSAPGIVNLCLESIAAEPLVIECGINGVMISPSSGCTSSTGGASHVLLAMGISEQSALSSIRISLSSKIGSDEIKEGVKRMVKSVSALISH